MSGALVAYPLVVVRTRLQAQGMKGRPIIYNGAIDCMKKIYSAEGLTGFYKYVASFFYSRYFW